MKIKGNFFKENLKKGVSLAILIILAINSIPTHVNAAHTHTDDCYDGHRHNESCYDTHVHDESCYSICSCGNPSGKINAVFFYDYDDDHGYYFECADCKEVLISANYRFDITSVKETWRFKTIMGINVYTNDEDDWETIDGLNVNVERIFYEFSWYMNPNTGPDWRDGEYSVVTTKTNDLIGVGDELWTTQMDSSVLKGDFKEYMLGTGGGWRDWVTVKIEEISFLVCGKTESTTYLICTNIEDTTAECNKVVTAISAINKTQTVYKGAGINTNALITYLDDSTETKTVNSNYNSSISGVQNVTLTYSGLVDTAKTSGVKTASITVNVYNKCTAGKGHSDYLEATCPICGVIDANLEQLNIYKKKIEDSITLAKDKRDNTDSTTVEVITRHNSYKDTILSEIETKKTDMSALITQMETESGNFNTAYQNCEKSSNIKQANDYKDTAINIADKIAAK